MRVLVTGSTGFVGHALVDALEAQGHEVKGLSRRAGEPKSFRADLLDEQQTREVFSAFQPEIVYHTAARTGLKDPGADFGENVITTDHVMDAVEDTPSVRRVVFLSSQLVNRPGHVPQSDTEYDPPDDYGASKAEAERHVRHRDGGGREWVIGRSTTIWGPGMSEHYASVIRMIARGLYFHIGGKPLWKSYSYIDNLSSQLVSLGTAPVASVNRKTFYLADSQPIDLRAWTGAFAEEYGRRIPTLPAWFAKLLGRVGDVATGLGRRSPITSARVQNVLTEYIYPTGPIDNLHGPTRIHWRDGVKTTAAWIRNR